MPANMMSPIRGVRPLRTGSVISGNSRVGPVRRMSQTIVAAAVGVAGAAGEAATRNPFLLAKKKKTLYNYDRMHRKWILLPNCLFRRLWDFFVAIFVIYLAWKIPISVCFNPIYMSDISHPWYPGFLAMDTFLEVFFVIDIFLSFMTGYIRRGHIEMDPKKIATHYLRGWFIIDAIAVLPINELLADLDKSSRKAIKITKVLKMSKLLRIGRIVRYMKQYFKFRHLMLFGFTLVLISHVMTCLWYFTDSDSSDTTQKELLINNTLQMGDVYMAVYEDVFQQLLGREPASVENWSDEQHILSIFICLLGAFMAAFLASAMVLILQSYGSAYENFQKHLQLVRSEMIRLHISDALQKKVNAYYSYLWLKQKSSVQGGFSLLHDNGMSLSLRKEIAVELAYGVLPISKVKSFQSCSDDCLAALVLRMRPYVCMPQDIIFNEGDLGRELFYVITGKIELCRKGLPTGIVLGEGTFFGEIAVLSNGRRMLMARAVSFADLQTLEKEDLELVFSDFPEYRTIMHDIALQRLLSKDTDKHSKTKAKEHAGTKRVLQRQLTKSRLLTKDKVTGRSTRKLQIPVESSSSESEVKEKEEEDQVPESPPPAAGRPLSNACPDRASRTATDPLVNNRSEYTNGLNTADMPPVNMTGAQFAEILTVVREQTSSLAGMAQRTDDMEERMAYLGSLVKQLPQRIGKR